MRIPWLLLLALIIAGFPTTLFVRLETGAIELYQRVGSPVMGHLATCRFDPSCSEYARRALEQDGLWRGNLRIGMRLVHCSPAGLLWDQARSSKTQAPNTFQFRKL